MSDANTIVQRVDAVLTSTLRQQRMVWTSNIPYPDISDVFNEIEHLARSGKRLRPQFAHWGWVAAGGDPTSTQPGNIGAAIELLHIFALLHDDVIDGAEERRGWLTTHIRMAKLHSEENWAGNAHRFGEGAAILFGDIAYVISDSLMNSLSPAARELWHDLRLEMNMGQYLDTLVSARREIGLESAELVSRYKTAKYTIERPLHIGAVAANRENGFNLLPMFTAYGLPLGEAFQMRDDILGGFGNRELTGKPVGGDFIEGKRTPLLARAYAAASDGQRKILDTVGSPSIDVAQVQEAIIATGAVAEMERHISALHYQAVSALQKSALAGNAYEELISLADVVTQRQN
jgi:geranylgeranyl diphosphate synthase type I